MDEDCEDSTCERSAEDSSLDERTPEEEEERESESDLGDSASWKPQNDPDEDVSSTISVEIQSENITADSIKAAGVYIEQLNLLSDSASLVAVKLSAQHFRVWAPEDLERCEAELVFDSGRVEELSQTLEEKRLLILVGDPESGKGSTVLLAASTLIRRKHLKGALSCQGLDATVSVDLDEISGAASFGRQLVLLEDALAGENPDLSRFLRTLDAVRCATLAERLRKNGSTLVLTATSHTIETCEARLASLGILQKVGPPSLDLRLLALRRFAERLPFAGGPRETLMAFLEANGEDLARDLGTIPKIVRFVQEYLQEVAEGKLTLRQALDRMEDLSQWLMNDLASDLDAQAAALSIVLCSAAPPAIGVPCFSFDRLRRMILDLLRRELRIPDDQPLSPQGLGRGSVFLDRARARVVDMPAPLPDVVRFKDDRYPRRLWQALLGSGRSLATMLLPLLQDLTSDFDPFLQMSAARALGRLGQIDPIHEAVPHLLAWTLDVEPTDDRAAAFLQGAVASSDGGYRDFCLARIRHLASQEGATSAAAAIRALRLIGRPDPAMPLEELRRIVRHRLPIQIELLRRVEREVATMEGEIRLRPNPRRVAAELRALHQESQKVMAPALVSTERLPILGAFQYSLAGVLLAHGGDPGPVLRELIPWMKTEPEKLAPLVAYLFLHRKGLIDLLDRHKWISGSFGTEACSRFLLSASRGAEEAAVLREFLERLFRSLQIFPGLFRSVLEQRFLQILRNWSQEGCKVIGLRPVVIGLLSGLLASEDQYLRKTIHHFLKTDSHFAARGSRLRALAVDALTGKGLDPIPAMSPRPRRLPSWMAKKEGETA